MQITETKTRVERQAGRDLAKAMIEASRRAILTEAWLIRLGQRWFAGWTPQGAVRTAHTLTHAKLFLSPDHPFLPATLVRLQSVGQVPVLERVTATLTPDQPAAAGDAEKGGR